MNPTIRITGQVLAVNRRRGTSKGETPKPYDFVLVTVLVGEVGSPVGIAIVQGDPTDFLPANGDLVDLTAEVSQFRGDPQLRYVAEWVSSALV